jgi:hypothetical protein
MLEHLPNEYINFGRLFAMVGKRGISLGGDGAGEGGGGVRREGGGGRGGEQ